MRKGNIVTLKDSKKQLIGLVIDTTGGNRRLVYVLWEPYTLNNMHKPIWISEDRLEVLNG